MGLVEKVNKSFDRISQAKGHLSIASFLGYTGYKIYQAYNGEPNIFNLLDIDINPLHIGLNEGFIETFIRNAERISYFVDPNVIDERLVKSIGYVAEGFGHIFPFLAVPAVTYIALSFVGEINLSGKIKSHKANKREGYFQAYLETLKGLGNKSVGIDRLKGVSENFCKYLGMQEMFVKGNLEERLGESKIYDINRNLVKIWTEDMIAGKIFPHFMFMGIFNRHLLRNYALSDVISQANTLAYAVLRSDKGIFRERFGDILSYEVDKKTLSRTMKLEYVSPEKRAQAMHEMKLTGYMDDRDRYLYLAECADCMIQRGYDFEPERNKALELLYGLTKRLSFEEKGELLRIGQTKNSVFMQADDRTYVFKEGKREDLEDEFEILVASQRVVENENQEIFGTPKYYSILNVDFGHRYQDVMVLERIPGITFADKIKINKWTDDDLRQVIDYMNLLDNNLKIDMPKEDLTKKLEERIDNIDFIGELDVRENVKDLILSNIDPLLDSFEPYPLVMDFDHQPEQYIFGSKLIRVDFEKKNKVPRIMMPAKLFGFSNYLSLNRQECWLSYAISQWGLDIPEEDSLIAYHNAIIYQAISVSSFISSSRSDDLLIRKETRIKNALTSLDRLKGISRYSIGHRKEYNSIELGLSIILDSMSSHN